MEEILQGRGELKENGVAIGDAEYKLFISERNGVISGRGTIYADPMILLDAYEAKSLTLTREDTGKDIRIVVNSYTPGHSASFAVNGSPD
jgi:hypothetical protein